MSFSILLFCTNDSFFKEKYFLINQACKDLQKKLEDKKIPSEIVFYDYYKENQQRINIKDLFPLNEQFVKINYNFTNFEGYKSYKQEIIPKQLKLAVNKAKYDFVLLKSIDTFFNNDMYSFLKNSDFNENYFYNSYRYDHPFSNEIIDYLKFSKDYKTKFKINDYSSDFKYNYFMKLHTNAVGDFILVSKKSIKKVKFISTKLYNDLLLIYKLHSRGLKQYIIQDGAIIKFFSNTAWNMNIKTLELTKTQIKFENFLYKKFTSKQINLIRGILNYPKQTFKGKKISSYERSVILRVFLNKIFKIPLY